MTDLPAEVAVLIVGAGPAGLAAAAELRARGIGPLLVIERDRDAGGVPRFCGHSPYGFREFRRPMFGPAYAKALVDQARRSGATIATGVMATALLPGPKVAVTSDAGTTEIAARAVLLATGVRETSRAARLIGGTKPRGVLSTGALQSMVYGAGQRPFRRPVILGTELVAFSAVLTSLHAGARPVMMVESGERVTARRPAALMPGALGIPLRLGTRVAAVEGRDRVEAVVLETPDGPAHIPADGLVVTGGFTPESTLLHGGLLQSDPGSGGPVIDTSGRCSEPGYYAAGNLLRPVETAGWCWSEGRRVARAIADDLTGTAQSATSTVTVSGDALRFALPQRIAPGDPVLDHLQIRMSHAARGRLSLRIDGQEIAGRTLSALPERRYSLPLPPPGRDAEVTFEESRP